MATPLADLIPMLQRQLNPSGAEQYPDFGGGDYLGYLADGFWDARLHMMLNDWTLIDGADLATPQPTGKDYITDQSSKTDDFPEQFQMLVVIVAGVRLIRSKILTLAINYSAKAGPIEYEQQASATTLRAILASLEDDLAELKVMYADDFQPGAMYYFDGILQRGYAELNGYLAMAVL